MENEKRLMFLASEVTIAEEDKLDPVFLSITLKLCDSVGNRNDEGVTEAFINDVVSRQEKFECLPFYADKKNLLARNYDRLGHMYNKITKKFGTEQIGSLTGFYSETDEDGVVSLYATARVPKREYDICVRLVELYEMGKLAVSFEVRYNPEYTVQKDGVVFIDANEDNALTGIALVWMPACVDAVALDMVAEVADGSDIVAESEEQTSERGETETMPKEEMTAEIEEKTAEENEIQEETPIAVAEGEGASESGGEGASESGGEGASESGGEGASESGGEGASESGGGAGASEGGSEGGSSETVSVDNNVPTIDPSEDTKKANAEAEDANAEVLEHSVDTHESVENFGGEPVHVIEYHERVIETMEEAGLVIAEQERQIAELTEIKAKYDAIIAEQEQRELASKRANAKAFAEKQGLDVTDTAVAEAIESLDYAKIAELTMAATQEAAEEEPAKQTMTLASYVSIEVGNENQYGGLLGRKQK